MIEPYRSTLSASQRPKRSWLRHLRLALRGSVIAVVAEFEGKCSILVPDPYSVVFQAIWVPRIDLTEVTEGVLVIHPRG